MRSHFGNELSLSTPLSVNYSVSDFTTTSTGLPNVPDDAVLSNMQALAATLEMLRGIDTFTIASAYRSPVVNAAVGGADNSYHSSGLAADIIPDHMTNQDFWYAIHNNANYRDNVGEYILYPLDHQSIHVSAPTATKRGFDLVLNSADQYVRSGIAIVEEAASSNPTYVGLIALGIGLSLFALLRVREEGHGRQGQGSTG